MDAAVQNYHQWGFAVVRGQFSGAALAAIATATAACFEAVNGAIATHGAAHVVLPPSYRFDPYSTALNPIALEDFGLASFAATLRACLTATPDGLALLDAIGGLTHCTLTRATLRHQYAPHRAHPLHHPNRWHQEGAYGVTFPPTPDQPPYCTPPPTPMVTLWLPLTPCGIDAPSLELYPIPQTQLFHYHALNDADLAAHFAPTPPELVQLEPGDGVLVHWGTLHRSGVRVGMRCDRFSLGLRWFNPTQIPAELEGDRWLLL
ncbi:hypothetical protein [Spirulina major]|uniref:hypothetical protein n=1 Tax=Spirulina major TaxID=270636 RepID=UPI000934724E|nr:hypothetical protein [Spirulina major]